MPSICGRHRQSLSAVVEVAGAIEAVSMRQGRREMPLGGAPGFNLYRSTYSSPQFLYVCVLNVCVLCLCLFSPSPIEYFSDSPACISPVSDLYFTVSLVSPCIPVFIFIYNTISSHFATDHRPQFQPESHCHESG